MRRLVLEAPGTLAWHDVAEPELIAAGRLHPERVTSSVAAWDDAAEALLEPQTKLVVER